MEKLEETTLPPWTWRVLGLTAVGLLLTAVLGIGLISAGVFDPRPYGQLQEQLAPGERELAAGEQQLDWLDWQLPPEPFSLRLTAVHERGERDIGYGVALGHSDAHVVVAVSPLGYVAIWQEADGQTVEQMPWQTWPHVHRDEEPNEIQLDVSDGQVSVRINREFLWQGEWRQSTSGVGLYAESFGDGTRIDFQKLELYDDS